MKSLFIATIMSFSQPAHASTVLLGFTFDDDAFADVVLSDVSDYEVRNAPDAVTALIGSDFNSFAFKAVENTSLTLGFEDNVILNGPGDDLIVFELDVTDAEPIVATMNGIRSDPQEQKSTGVQTTLDPIGTIHYTSWDLADFGVADGDFITTVTLAGLCTEANKFIANCTVGSDISSAFLAVGALNSAPKPIPLPFTGGLLLGGVFSLSFFRRNQSSSIK